MNIIAKLKEMSEAEPYRPTPKQVVETMKMVKDGELSFTAAKALLKECAIKNTIALRNVKKLLGDR